MNNKMLLPKLAIGGIKKNGSSYMPYLLVNIFAVFTFFTFSGLCDNPLMDNLPNAPYFKMLMNIGKVLMVFIMIPILMSTDQFLIKQRKKELGLYHILGLDRKYIGLMMFYESAMIYVVSLIFGIGIAIIFSKLIFLLLLYLSGLQLQVTFNMSIRSLLSTLLIFGVMSLVNLGNRLWSIYRSKPVEMMKAGQKGEKDSRFLGVKSFFGFLCLGAGYYLALQTKLDSMIFVNFFLEVLLVVWGNRLLFCSGSISILKKLKKNKEVYYKKENFVTISGMLYRMRRNAQSLANICIFSTMIIITLICTITVTAGKKEIFKFNNPVDVLCIFDGDQFKNEEGLKEEIEKLGTNSGIQNIYTAHYTSVAFHQEGNIFMAPEEENGNSHIRCISLAEYNALEGTTETLNDDEVLYFTPGPDLAQNRIEVNGQSFKVKKELQHFPIVSKNQANIYGDPSYVVVKNQAIWQKVIGNSQQTHGYFMGCLLKGSDNEKQLFAEALGAWCQGQKGYVKMSDAISSFKQSENVIGGLIFLGIFCGILFTVCVILLMYYKQLSEGYEDQKNFKIFKQVGMSNQEIKGTIKRQIVMVFFIPLIMAFLHTFMALHVVSQLLATIYFFNTKMMLVCSLMVFLVYTLIYVASYWWTSKAYYQIVK